MNGSVKFIATCGLALGICTGTQAAEAKNPLDQPFLLGAFTGPGYGTAKFEALIGHTIALVNYFQKFSALPNPGFAKDIAAGRVPMVSWTSSDTNGDSVLAIDILDGIYDQHVQDVADAIAALKGTVMLEWEPEMLSNKRDQQFYTGVPPDQWGPTYVAVWQHMHDIFIARGATNVQWVWSPTGTEYKTEQNGQIACAPYFPGLGYVDWMGLHSYNKLNKPQSFVSENETTFYYQAPIFGPGLPLIISQTAAGNTTRAQRVWIATAHSSIPRKY